MTTYAPLFQAKPPEFQVLYRQTFGASEATGADAALSAADWSVLAQPTPGQGGVELINIDRKSLPNIGTAEFRYIYGAFVGGAIAKGPDIKRWEVRLQLRPAGSTGSAGWKTEFWGHVDVQEDQFMAGSTVANGSTVYRCVDGFARTTKWQMNRHEFDGRLAATGGEAFIKPELFGNPGYNYQLATDGPVLGNRSKWAYAKGSTIVFAHTWQGAYASADVNDNQYKWAEWDAIDHGVKATRPATEPYFRIISGAADGYGMFNPIEVAPNESVFDFVTKLTQPSRGLGIVSVWWEDQVSGAIKVGFRVSPPYKSNVFYDDPVTGAASAGYIIGADTAGTSYANEAGQNLLVLQGDGRVIDRDMVWSDSETHLHDYVETIGENVEVVATFSYKNNTGVGVDKYYDPDRTECWAARWSDADNTAFIALATTARMMQYWDFVWQTHGLPRDWNGFAGNGYEAGAHHRIDWQCADNGTLFIPGATQAFSASPCMVELLSSMPLYQGYDYAGTAPSKTDNTQQAGAPTRRPLAVYLNLDSGHDRWYLPTGQLPSVISADPKFTPQAAAFSPNVSLHSDALLCYSPASMEIGDRVFANKSVTDLNALYDVSQLAFTLSVKMPYHVRMCTTTVATDYPNLPTGKQKDWRVAKRKKTVYVRGVHLWLLDYEAIYDLSQTDYVSDQGFAPRRGGAGGIVTKPGVLRDDRNRLVIYHTMVSTWYMAPRRRIRIGIKSCLMVPQQMIKDGVMSAPVTEVMPKLGDYIHQMSAAGQLLDVGTVVTSVHYNHQAGETTMETDWYDMEVI